FEQDEKPQDNSIVNVIGALQPRKECQITISYVSELDLVQNGRTIHFVVPTIIAPRYNPIQVDFSQKDVYAIKFA
ncbi:unnamed protein product, partial [Rotaria sp. Silwood2]